MKFANIPKEVLDTEIKGWDDTISPLRDCLTRTVNEDIKQADYLITYDEDENPVLEIFSAETENYILKLLRLYDGTAFLTRHDRIEQRTNSQN